MAVAFDAVGTQRGSGAGATSPSDVAAATMNLTIGAGSNVALVYQVVFVATITSPAVIWDQGGTNQSMTLITSHATSNGQLACLFGLIAPTSGKKAVRLTWTGGATEYFCQGVSWTGVDQTGGATSFPHSTFATGNSSAVSVAVTSAVGNATMSAAANGTFTGMNSVSATQTFLGHGAGSLECGGSRAAGAATVTMTATLAGTDNWVIVGTDILASGGTAATWGPLLGGQNNQLVVSA